MIRNVKMNKKREACKVGIMLVVITAVTGFPYLEKGLCGYLPDLLYHLLRIEGVKQALQDGCFPVRIYENFFNGYGYGSPLFYPDIFLIFPAGLRLLSVSPLAAWKIFALCITVMASITTYFSMRYIFKDSDYAITITFLLMLSQFYLADLLGRVGISEYLAFCFMPIWLAGIYDFFMLGGKKTYLIGIGFAGLLHSHIIMTFIALFFTVIIFGRMLFVKKENNYLFDTGRMKRLIFAAVGTILSVAYYLFPMTEQMFVGGGYKYQEPWAYIGNYVQPFSTFFRITGYFNCIAFVGIGLPIIILSIICIFLRKPKNKWAAALFGFGWLIFVGTTSIVPWEKLENTILNMIQFTYRFYPYALLFVIVGIMLILAENLKDNEKRKQISLSLIIVSAVIAGIVQNQTIHSSEESKLIDGEYLEVNNFYVGAGEWLPIDVSDDIVSLAAATEVRSDIGLSQELDNVGKHYSFYTDEGAAEYLIPLIYYKGYKAEIIDESGKSTQLRIDRSDNAQLVVYNDTGINGEIRIKYAGTTVQHVSTAITVLFIITILLYSVRILLMRKQKSF